jgi:peptidoglycan hydrolase-like protein with peptidoglycan-binding domain
MKGEPLKKTDPKDIARIQSDLELLGYDPGKVDGTYGPKTRQALKRFQEDHGIQADAAEGTLTEMAILKAIHARRALQNNTPKNLQPAEESNP